VIAAQYADETAGHATGTPIRLDELVGADVRVTARRGYVVSGRCLDAWQLREGGIAVRIKPSDGSAPRELTTTDPVVLLSQPRVRRSPN